MKTALLSVLLLLVLSAPIQAGSFGYRSLWGYPTAGVYSPYYGRGYAVDNFGGIGVWQNYVYPTWGFQQYVPPVSGYNPGVLPGYWNNGYFIPGW